MTRTYRSMTPLEQDLFHRELRRHFYQPFVNVRKPAEIAGAVFALAVCLAAGFLAGVVLAVLWFVLSRIFPGVDLFGQLAAPVHVRLYLRAGPVLGVLGLPFWFWIRLRSAVHKRQRLLKKDLTEGRVEVVPVCASRAERWKSLELAEELPPAFSLTVQNSKVLFLQGDYLREAVRTGHFPNTDFELVRGMHSGQIIRLECKGKPLLPRIRNTGKSFEDWTDGEVREVKSL